MRLAGYAAIFDAPDRGGDIVRRGALSGASAKEPLGVLNDVLPIEIGMRDGKLFVRDPATVPAATASINAVARENSEAFSAPEQTLGPASTLPHILTLRYYDSDRDFQASLQRSERGPVSRNAVQIELPAVLTAPDAKRIVDHRHLQLQYGRRSWRGDVALDAVMLFPGDCFLGDDGTKWRVEQTEQRFGSVGISARAAAQNMLLPGQLASPGRSLPSPDLTIGQTQIAAIEMPIFGTDDPGKPVVAIFAAGTGSGWRRAALSLVTGDSLIDIGTTAPAATMGTSVDPLLPHNVHLIDERDGLRVQLPHNAMDIAERTGSPLDIDAPYFWLGGEFIRFGNCAALGGGMYRLSRLRRGCFASENVIPLHPAGERFVLIEPETARLIEERAFGVGDTAIVEAMGLADSAPAFTSALIGGLAVRPLAPVHGRFCVSASGSVGFHWVRRSKIDQGWRDGVDQVMAEDQEQYLISLNAGGTPVGEYTSAEPRIIFSAASWAELGIAENAILTADVRQVGRHAQSSSLMIGR